MFAKHPKEICQTCRSESLCGLHSLPEVGLTRGFQNRAVSLPPQIHSHGNGDAVARYSLISVVTGLCNQPHPFGYFSQYSLWEWPALDQISCNFLVANRVNTFQFTSV